MSRRAAPALAACWTAETIRLREAHWGALDDADALRLAIHAGGDTQARILERARLLGEREHIDTLIERWRQGAVTAMALLLILAAITGAGTALGALGDGSRPVNVLWALGALLGLHAFTFLIWLLTFAFHGTGAGASLGRAWLWITRKLARGPDAALVPQALLNLLSRTGSLRWLFGSVSHLIWLVALLAALIAMLTVLSTARYAFTWATTLLDPERFVQLTRLLGWLPAHLGFSLPDAAIVRASDGSQVLPAQAQVQWSIWLIGLIVVYGILPRLLAWGLSLAITLSSCRRLELDLTLPGYAALAERLSPSVQFLDIERADDTASEPHPIGKLAPMADQRDAVMLAVELAGDLDWPPPLATADGTPAPLAGILDAGRLDSRAQRNHVLDALAQSPAGRLLVACDARQTPDRGTLAFIAQLSDKAGRTAVWLVSPQPAGQTRAPQWIARLSAAGMRDDDIVTDPAAAYRWLKDAT